MSFGGYRLWRVTMVFTSTVAREIMVIIVGLLHGACEWLIDWMTLFFGVFPLNSPYTRDEVV